MNSRSVPQQQLLDGQQRGDIGEYCRRRWHFSDVICMTQGPTSNLPTYLFFSSRVYLPLCVFSNSPAATYGLILCLLSLSSVSVEKLGCNSLFTKKYHQLLLLKNKICFGVKNGCSTC